MDWLSATLAATLAAPLFLMAVVLFRQSGRARTLPAAFALISLSMLSTLGALGFAGLTIIEWLR
ncbi:hypothetical protein DN824_06615 [Stutzerimonas nosocomialis]|uniref:Uncharacterized protein n=1 Tax=Stutzerimonas nosocomialis TaxID=1056496 RepID=A0A5R9R232_9GAMM|nr:hypothetical protein [Stutzerimonas nosocomialis]TLX59236.1 hypothetical protein DN826_00090 [Stutzerimonas nosocomialis]TLX60176.1 hypothetical protein DN824_06615 [Stutzerimonas nosocomialis]TLX64635.1 hypothetical protein DN820_04200 [Stutzerimonas nosocomialis]